MARLLSYLIGRTEALGRTNLVAPLGQLPELAARLEFHELVPETRSLRWGLREPQITRPYVDLVYW